MNLPNQYNFLTLEDSFDLSVTEFRKKVCIENGAPPEYINLWLNYKETLEYCQSLSGKVVFEEVWKFGNTKWRDSAFSSLEVLLDKQSGEIVSVSGCRRYSHNLLRVSMHLYTLKEKRRAYRNLQFSESGFFARHLKYAKKLKTVECLFMTVYPHNKTLQYHVKNLSSRRISPDGGKMHFIHELIPLEKTLKFNEVDQHFFLYPLSSDFSWPGTVPEPLFKSPLLRPLGDGPTHIEGHAHLE